ncbi:MAG TPA: hypothetical protein VNS55_13580 [Nocardioides sp.]|nr:hypothetical protein [Nocardioides sp.]
MSTHDDELAARTRAVLDAAAGHVFGTEPGRLAAELYDVLVRTTEDTPRARVAAALARVWVYGGHADRAAPFAEEALDRAERTGDPGLVAECLDAMLTAHWGPDELDLRLRLGARLDAVAAHVLDPEVRLRAHLWGLQVACETLHLQGIHRHLRALDALGEESARARFFAASRQWMYDVLRGRTDRAAALTASVEAASSEAGLADGWMIVALMRCYTAILTGDRTTGVDLAERMEEFGRAEGVPEVVAEAAWVWALLDRPDRVRPLLGELGGSVLASLPRDVNLLLTLQCTLAAALAVDDRELVAAAAALLAPFEDRAVVNAGAVYVHGVTDDTLSRAAAVLGDTERAERLRERALATYRRIGAPWWHDRLRDWTPPAPATPTSPPRPAASEVHLHPTASGVWLVGPAPGHPVRPLRGLDYLHRLLSSPGGTVPAIDLVSDGSGTVLQPGTGPTIDRQAAASYRRRLADIDAELAEAEQWADQGRAERLAGEREALLDELGAAAGLGGRARAHGSTRERARVAATKAIGTAIDRIGAIDADLGRHLRDSVRTGSECSYRPAVGDEVTWVLAARP